MDIHSNRKKALFSSLYELVHTLATRPSVVAGGIVFYANYLKFFERARTEWLRSLGIGQQALRDQTGGMFVVTDAQLRYHRSARLDDLLLVTARVLDAGRASLTIGQSALLKPQHPDAQATLLCEGRIRIGWVDGVTLKPQRIPAAVLDAIQRPA